MQDGPFAIMRLISIVGYNIVTYTNYFFTAKNALILMLQVYRMVSIYLEYREKKKNKEKDRHIQQVSKLYVNAFQLNQRK